MVDKDVLDRLAYIQYLYNLAFNGLESKNVDLQHLKVEIQFVDSQKILLDADRTIYNIRKTLKKKN